MNRISNIENIPVEYMFDPGFQTKMKTVFVGEAIGCEKLYANIDFVKPGAVSTKYHSHSKQEEIFLIMAGKGILRMDNEEVSIKAGDVISKPAGKDIAHQFINNGSEILQILDVGTVEKDDVATYPDDNMIFIRNRGLVFNINDSDKNWTSDPEE